MVPLGSNVLETAWIEITTYYLQMCGFFADIYTTTKIPIQVNNDIKFEEKVTEFEKQRI